jgi:hypothetical protein
MDNSDFKMSCEELEQLMPVLQKCDPVWSQFLQRQIALGRHYPKEAGCVRETNDRTQMDLFFLLGTTIAKPDRIEGVFNLEFLPDYHAKGVTFHESVRPARSQRSSRRGTPSLKPYSYHFHDLA